MHCSINTFWFCCCSQLYVIRVTRTVPRWRRVWPPCCELLPNVAVFRVFYWLFCGFSYWMSTSLIACNRQTLLETGSSVAHRKPDFEFLNSGALFTNTAAKPFFWAARLRKRSWKRGKRAGVLVRLRRRAFRPPLPTICWLTFSCWTTNSANWGRVSPANKKQGTAALSASQEPSYLEIPDSAIELSRFSVHRVDRMKEFTGKSRGGGVCFFINNSWCDERNIHSVRSLCSPDLEYLTLLCRPFWLPRVFTAVIITGVYPPPPPKPTQNNTTCAPLIWNTSPCCVDHSGFRGNLQWS